MLDPNQPEIKFALYAVQQAGLLIRQVQLELAASSLTKVDLSPVTVADFAAQALVGRLLSQTFPEDVLVAEEDSVALREPASAETLAQVTGFVSRFDPEASPSAVSDWIDLGASEPGRRFWTLDPVDGTKGFLRGGQYAVALALLVDGQVQVGVLGCPNLSDGYRPDPEGQGSLVVAARGQGTWATSLAHPGEFDPLNVSVRDDPALGRLLRSYESGHTNTGQIDRVVQVLGIQAEPVLMDSQAKYAILAAGKGDIMLRLLSPDKPDYAEKIWDQAAGSLVVEEAGGRVTDILGAPLDFTSGRQLTRNKGVVATNGRLHEPILQALRTVNA